MESDAVEEWKQPMDEEMKVLKDRGVGEEVNRPINKSVLKGRWVYKLRSKRTVASNDEKEDIAPKGTARNQGKTSMTSTPQWHDSNLYESSSVYQ